MLGGRFRDRIRCYADTTESHDPKVYGERLKKRRDQGFTWLKMDIGNGSRVIEAGTGLRICNTFNPQHPGTRLIADESARSMAR
jgi:L-alanine-DL-glutamate epimerase-like enolase superfamily enzyme